ncbi:MAG: TetR/AcrR family transcriptional regulator C-terminal domain-containing protein [Atopobiaceae bacterium]|nr:TetR/AcrR family transcriptional regulator C-terminal domain-containing protein [Atopobiaceae bacterium]
MCNTAHIVKEQEGRSPVAPTASATDRRSLRTRRALVLALADEMAAAGDLSRVTVTAVAERAGITRRTFYSHYRDISDIVASTEDALLAELVCHVSRITKTRLDDLHACLDAHEPCPGLVELLEYIVEHGRLYAALMGVGGDPSFAPRIKEAIHGAVIDRALEGLDTRAAGRFLDYYVSYVISAEVGVIAEWLDGGMHESPQAMARIMTLLAFVRPGDLYDHPLNINVPAYGLALMQMKEDSDD